MTVGRACVVLIELLACCSEPRALRVCADPNNLPFSNRAGEGFENKIAEIVARDLERPVAYTWFPRRRGFIRNTLRFARCDVVIGVPAGEGPIATTRPYYRSTYVFVTRVDRHLAITSLDDPRLRGLRIGVDANAPPQQVLTHHGLQDRIVGFSTAPPRALIDAVARGDVDLAIAWGPLAGWAATHADVPLEVHPIERSTGDPLPLTFDIAMGVRERDAKLRKTLDDVIARRGDTIASVLGWYGVPAAP